MPKPRKKRVVRFDPEVTYFKPRGVPLSELEEVILAVEELEALRLANFENLNQTKAAKKMKVSQSTFNRVLASARRKTSEALVYGKAIKVEGGDYTMPIGRGMGRRLGRGGGPAPLGVRGSGRGRMGGPFAAGPGGSCICTNEECKHEILHQIGVPCAQQKCPKCESPMIRKREG